MNANTKQECAVTLEDQRWNSTESATLIRTGLEMLNRFENLFPDRNTGRVHLESSSVGDCFKTCVSAYERVV